MNCQAIVFLTVNAIPWIVADSRLKSQETPDQGVDVIHFPFELGNESNSSAFLTVDLKDLNNFTVCFVFMVDGLVDVVQHVDIATFRQMLLSLSVFKQFESIADISFESGSFAPYQWIHTCFSVTQLKTEGNITLVVNGNEKATGKLDFKNTPWFLNMTLENAKR